MNNYDNIEEALKNFTTQNEATITQSASNLLQVLNFSFPVRKEMQVDIVTWYKNRKKTDPPQDLTNAAIKLGNAFFLGTIGQENSNDFQILFFAVEANQDLTRSNMASVTRALNRMSDSWPVLILFRQKHLISLALSERTDYTQQWRQGQKIGKIRILMNINCIKPHRGHLDLLCQMADQKKNADAQNTYKQLLDTFSVENLTEKFYREIQNWYFWAVQNAQFPNKSDDPNDYKAYNYEAIIRLITRLIFVWFLKEKGLINPDLFDYKKLENVIKDFNPNDPENGNYYNAILQNLFFATLNQKIEERHFVAKGIRRGTLYYDIKTYYRAIDLFISKDENKIVKLFAQTPYVNGSLFSCLDDKQDNNGNKYNFDGFSNFKTSKAGIIKRAFIPNLLFFAGENATNANLADFFEKEEEKRIYQDVKMTGILTILSKYHFTIEENTPLDEQVALDPELLGKVFENLLGAFNPETKTKARKQTGSFYTPRQIVDYMVVQSLTRYFKTKCPKINEQDLHSLLEDNDLPKPDNINEEQTNSLIKAVCQCKIIDPACGSGAFPMGILQRLVSLLNKLDPDNSKWHEIVKNEALERTGLALDNPDTKDRDDLINSIKDDFTRQTASPDYARKLYIIANCIHGVDIQTIAIQISKLRFFISLLCEQKTNDNPEDNFGIKPLPNLETKLVAADSLMPPAILKFENEIQEDFTNTELKKLMKQLADIRIRHIAPKDRKEKQELEKKDRKKCGEINTMLVNRYGKIKNIEEPIKQLNEEISRQEKIIDECQEPKWELREEATQTDMFAKETVKATRLVNVDVNKRKRDEALKNIKNCEKEIERLKNTNLDEFSKAKLDEYSKAVKQMTNWDPYDQNASAPFFYPNWMFNVYNGFDIVIANPPYVQLQDIEKGNGRKYESVGFETYDRKGDMYCLFYEKALQLCANNAFFCFITSNKWMRSGYGDKTRNLLATHNPTLLVDFGGTKVFKATVDCNILITQKALNQGQTTCCTINDEKSINDFEIDNYVKANCLQLAFRSSDSWIIENPLEKSIRQKIESVGTPLAEWNVRINYGIKTGYNPAFIISTERRNNILNNCLTEDEKIRTEKLIRPILRGKDIDRYKYNWADKWLIATFPSRHYDIEEYPAVKQFLLTFTMQKLEQTGKKYILDDGTEIDARKKTNNKWFETQDSIAYWQDFDKPKIIYPNMTKYLPFYYDEKHFLTNDKSFILTGEHIAYLTAFLNSSMFKKFFREYFPHLRGETRELRKIFFDKIPVKKVSDEVNEKFKVVVNDIQSKYTKEKAIIIDNMIFDVYGITTEDREAIGFIEIT